MSSRKELPRRLVQHALFISTLIALTFAGPDACQTDAPDVLTNSVNPPISSPTAENPVRVGHCGPMEVLNPDGTRKVIYVEIEGKPVGPPGVTVYSTITECLKASGNSGNR